VPIALTSIIVALCIRSSFTGGWDEYPLTHLPEVPDFVEDLRADTDDFSVLLLPMSPQDVDFNRNATIESEASLLNPQMSLWLQVVLNRPMRHHPFLRTLVHSSASMLYIDRAYRSDIGYQRYQERLAATWVEPEVRWLAGEGYKYMIMDESTASSPGLDTLVYNLDLPCFSYESWGGVLICKLYDERPTPTEFPGFSPSDSP
ncbi:MAG: hypothetical protein QGG40_13470, partial [Myxococcota bacterium]|nr:hypothetical protein [Myxococcota bacterium]